MALFLKQLSEIYFYLASKIPIKEGLSFTLSERYMCFTGWLMIDLPLNQWSNIFLSCLCLPIMIILIIDFVLLIILVTMSENNDIQMSQSPV